MKELKFNTEKSKHILLLPGLLAPAQSLFPLVWHLRKNQKEYGVTAIPLGLSIADFDKLVERATAIITQNLFQKTQPKTVILFGHSHGGRVACELVRRLKKLSPSTEFSVITAGSPMGKKLNYLSWLRKNFFRISKAYRSWPHITQPDSSVVTKYIGYYSDSDWIVIPEMAKADYLGELIELHGVSHYGLASPAIMGPILLKFLTEQK